MRGSTKRVIATSIDESCRWADYVLSGGDSGAGRDRRAGKLMDGALNDARSSVEESFADGLLDWPHYTRPEQFAGLRVPEVLLGGDHERIRRWRLREALGRTWRRRPDLFLTRAGGTAEEIELLNEYLQERRIEK